MSVCRPFFLGQVASELLFPYPELDPDEAATLALLRDSMRRFAAERIDSVRIDEEARIPPEVLQGLAELGIFGVLVPAEYDGFGASTAFYTRVFETVATLDGSIVVTFGAHQSIGLKGILLFGTEDQKRRFLPGLANGQFAAFALTEPTSGSDAASIRTRARWDEERGAWILNGSKIWITNGGFADVFTVFAQTEVEKGGQAVDRITAFIVPRSLPGVSTGPEEHKLGIRGSSTTEVHFQDVAVPPGNLLGVPGGGFKVAMEVLNSGRLGLAGGCVGGAKVILAEATRAATEREQFGRPLAEFELIQKSLARMAMDIYAMEAMVHVAAALVDRGDTDFSIESAVCKVHCSETLWRIVDDAVQIAGGMGYMRAYPWERHLRDARINQIFEGTNEILRLYAALSGLEEPGANLKAVARALRDPIKQMGLLTDYAKGRARRALSKPELPELHPDLADLADPLAASVADLAGTVEWVLRRHGRDIVERQLVLERLADAVTWLYRMATVVSRADAGRRAGEGVEAAAHVSRARWIVDDAARRVRHLLAGVRSNLDDELRVTAAEVVANDGAWLPGETPIRA
jgi:acyl-CoA dehydrogenase family protein 9